MPYESVSDLPDQTQGLSAKQKRAFKQAFNSAYEKHGEERAFKIAWAAAKQVSKHAEVLEFDQPRASIGQWLESRLHLELTRLADDLYGRGKIDRKQRIALSSAIGRGLERYTKVIETQAPEIYELKKLAPRGWSTPDGLAALAQANPEWVTKHLIGRHNQKDHDPTKGGHTRAQHKEMVRPQVERVGLAGTLGVLSGMQALRRSRPGHTIPTSSRLLYGLYALNFAIAGITALDEISRIKGKPVTEVARQGASRARERVGKRVDVEPDLSKAQKLLEKLSRVSGVREDQILLDFADYLFEHDIERPTKDDVHEFVVTSYGHKVQR